MSDVAKVVLEARLRNQVIKDRVHSVLLDYPATRGDDLALAMRYYRRYYPFIKSLWDLERASYEGRVPTPDTLSRRRRELVYDEGHAELLPREGTQRKRLKNAVVYWGYYGLKPLMDFEAMQ